MYKRYKYRFKTEDEFLEENGEHWRGDGPGFNNDMDYLLGTDVYYDDIKDYLNCDFDIDRDVWFDVDSNIYNHTWTITNYFIKKVKNILPPNYEPRKFVYE